MNTSVGSRVAIHEDRQNRIMIRVPRELKELILKDAEQYGGKKGGWGKVSQVTLEILAKHYGRTDLLDQAS